MKEINFIVLGKPIAKQRVRVTRKGFSYTPKETVEYEKLVRFSAPKNIFIKGAIDVVMIFNFEPPKSVSKIKREQMLLGLKQYTKKPDLDNLAKSILDALNGVIYKDDSQIIGLRVIKKYNVTSNVEVKMRYWDE